MNIGKIVSIISNLVKVKIDFPVGQNEICHIKHNGLELMSEVIRVSDGFAFIQVFESTQGLKIDDEVIFRNNMLEVTLGPGLLSRNYDGLQNDLDKLTGTFLRRGEVSLPLAEDIPYHFKPLVKKGDIVSGGDWLGSVKENWIDHKIMVPFKYNENGTIKWIAKKGEYFINDKIAKIQFEDSGLMDITMTQKWPVKVPIRSYRDKPRPSDILQTGVRSIDTFNPITEGGTGFIPGPFGAGKTVLQHALAKNAKADLIIMTACGERANEVVEIFTEFPELIDANTGRKLQERTTIICNTSNMPVAAREASIYVGMTIAEYYRNMGLKVLLLADSTSRWAQALREMSNRMEELPGPDAYPIDLSAVIANYYARAGRVELRNRKFGSVTFIGTVSPAGGNLKEPVTESTRKVARCFYALDQKRADAKRYPAIEPLESYSKYLEYPEFISFANMHIEAGWVEMVGHAKDIVKKGEEAKNQINILGDDAVPIEYHILFWKREVIDFIILQQDAFDEIDENCPIDRQKYMLKKVLWVCDQVSDFNGFEEVINFYRKVIDLLKQMNYSPFESIEFKRYEEQLNEMFAQNMIVNDQI